MKDLSPEQLTILATDIANGLAKNKTIEEINLIRTICTQISVVLSTYSLQKITNQNNEYNTKK